MSRLILTIDQTPCRASYGLLGPGALGSRQAADQRQAVRENIAAVVARGDRLAKIVGDSVASIAGEAYPSKPVPDVTVVAIDRPTFGLAEAGGLDIVI